jgi:tRNA threonylcarbamoyladenosine biosynthesis protein TsaB
MTNDKTASPAPSATSLLLAIDTCGPTGSVALARLTNGFAEIISQTELEGRNYSATLIAAVANLLTNAKLELSQLTAIVAVIGPGSFTGVRVGLSAVKGLAEFQQIPVVAVSRLEVLAWKAHSQSSALDAHRQEVFLRLATSGSEPRELLVGSDELAALHPPNTPMAVCDDAAANLFQTTWPTAHQIRVEPPTAADALKLCAPRVAVGDFVDLALLDGHYLRRSDAEIFGAASKAAKPQTA